MVIGIVMAVVALALAGRRVLFLYRLARRGQPAPERIEAARNNVGAEVEGQAVEVLGQKKLLKWTGPGLAHLFVMWAFILLLTVYLEAAVALFGGANAHIPGLQTWPPIGFVQDTIALACTAGLIAFTVIRFRNSPKRLDRGSRFRGSHLGGAWLTLFMIFNVIWTMFFYRGVEWANGNFPYGGGAYFSSLVGHIFDGLSHGTLDTLEHIGLLLHIAVALIFLVFVVHSKHLHIFLAAVNVIFKRRPDGLGAAQPMRSHGKILDFEEADPDTDVFGRGKIEDFT